MESSALRIIYPLQAVTVTIDASAFGSLLGSAKRANHKHLFKRFNTCQEDLQNQTAQYIHRLAPSPPIQFWGVLRGIEIERGG